MKPPSNSATDSAISPSLLVSKSWDHQYDTRSRIRGSGGRQVGATSKLLNRVNECQERDDLQYMMSQRTFKIRKHK
jgi:hypothetical protein